MLTKYGEEDDGSRKETRTQEDVVVVVGDVESGLVRTSIYLEIITPCALSCMYVISYNKKMHDDGRSV